MSNVLKTLWQTDKKLTAVGLLMSGLLVLNVACLLIDPRYITAHLPG